MLNPDRRRFLGAVATGALGASLPSAVDAAPAARLIDARWRQFGGSNGPDHSAWDQVLRQYRQLAGDGIARFNYRAASAGPVAAYVDSLAAVDPATLNANAAFCYWANMYNAITVRLVLDAYPVESIRDIGGGFLSRGPWRSKVVQVAGADLSLDDIEHGILRPIWQDARVHYAVNCAALGCPNLAARAYAPGRLASMLDEGARDYVNHPRGVDMVDGRLVASSIYDWFEADFGGNVGGVLSHMQSYVGPPRAPVLAGATGIARYRYDWGLNG